MLDAVGDGWREFPCRCAPIALGDMKVLFSGLVVLFWRRMPQGVFFLKFILKVAAVKCRAAGVYGVYRRMHCYGCKRFSVCRFVLRCSGSLATSPAERVVLFSH